MNERVGQASLRRLREFGVRPNRELGQNFLVDDNLLGVIARAAELTAEDVVLEVGGGLGVLSEYLAERVAHVHVVEVDRALEPALADALAPFDNTSLHLTDVVDLDLAALVPAPGKVVANLPYGVAASVIVRTVLELEGVGLWVAMVQREVARRMTAGPGSRVYGVTSAIVQLSCEVKLLRRVSPRVFYPVPGVESALVVLRRVAPAPSERTVALIHAAFAHRRKALPGAIALSPGAGGDLRDRARIALERIGKPPGARAEELSSTDFRALAEELGEQLASLAPRGTGG